MPADIIIIFGILAMILSIVGLCAFWEEVPPRVLCTGGLLLGLVLTGWFCIAATRKPVVVKTDTVWIEQWDTPEFDDSVTKIKQKIKYYSEAEKDFVTVDTTDHFRCYIPMYNAIQVTQYRKVYGGLTFSGSTSLKDKLEIVPASPLVDWIMKFVNASRYYEARQARKQLK